MRGTLAAIILLSNAAVATPTDRAAIVSDFEKTKAAILGDDVRQREIMANLFEINKKIRKIVSDKAELTLKQQSIDAQTKGLANQVLELHQKVKEEKSELRKRLSAIYRFGGQGFLRLVFSSKSSAGLERSLRILGLVAERDMKLIRSYQKNIARLESRKNGFLVKLRDLKKLEAEIQAQEIELAQEMANKNKVLDRVRQSQRFAMYKLSQLREQGRRAPAGDDSGLLDLLFQPSFFERKGSLPMPVNGVVAQRFGTFGEPGTNIYLSHKGLFFAAPQDSPVKAVFGGTVVFAGPVVGFGKTLILDHGDHYYTVYSHAKSLKVQEGQRVEENQVIAQTGIAEFPKRQGLYFEVRHFSEPNDPKHWIKGATL